MGVSGGKDSCAAAIATIEYLDAIGHTGPRILVHADLGDDLPELSVEWTDSLPTCERLADRLDIELVIVRRAAGGMMKRWQGRWSNNVGRYANLECVKVILPWSTPSMRFCTSELKSAPIAAALVKRFPGQTIISAAGIRRAESRQRSGAKTAQVNKRLEHKGAATTGLDWNPIAEWTDHDVFAFCAARDFAMHEGYTRYGMSRISCRFCIMAQRSDLVASTTCVDNVPVFRTMVALEVASTFAFQGASWLADVAPQLLDAETIDAIAAAKLRATAREEIEARIPAHLLYTEGWPTVMPTTAEAELLAEVRREIAALLDLDVKYIDAASIITRYAELMAENATKAKAKAKKAKGKVKKSTRSTKEVAS
ncbi:MAG: phosphoadenosine phosphosulfate reductase family protein [Myxococcota bacterium]|nr:phosphoadenosine phosphosulfate reductase family protein [Myxococcota bacterium]